MQYMKKATTEVVGSAMAMAMEIDRLSALPDEFLLSIQGFGTQPLLFNLWKMANYNNMATIEVVGSAVAMEIDRLSALPDDLLVDILRRLDNTKEAARTAALSKRWRFLWTKLPLFSFSFRFPVLDITRSFGLVREALATRQKAAISDQDYRSFRLYLSLYYDDTSADDLIALFNLASKSRVSEVDLNLVAINNRRSLPQALYSYPSLRRLSLEYLKLVPQATTVEWGLMTEISLLSVDLPQQAFDQIVSGCPLLSRLGVLYCSGFDRLDVRGRRFRELDVASNSRSVLPEISAPYMTSLNVTIDPVYTTLRFMDVSSVEQLSIYCSNFEHWKTTPFMDDEQLFQLLKRVTTLMLYRFLEVLSNRMEKGGQLPQFRVRHLTIKDNIDRDNITDVLAMLESSPFLDKLVLVIRDVYGLSHKSYRDLGVDLICDLLHLKTVEIIFDIGQQLPRALSFTLAQILLRRAPVLEEMVIRVENTSKLVDYELFSEMVKKFKSLLTHPKSSPKAQVYIILNPATCD